MMSVRHVVVVWCLAWAAASASDEAIVDEIRSSLVVSQLVLSHQSEALQLLVNATETVLRLLMKERSCPFPYTRVLDECFYLSTLMLSHSDARTHCQGMGGDLATPSHPYALASYLYDRGSITPSVGGSKTPNNEWRWFDGRPVDRSLWAPYQPSKINNRLEPEDCLAMWTDKHPPLNDYACVGTNTFVCQLKQ
ncbi:low affinity immunoglobulin epsilon Fc receptor-like [Procambarus clarkii]|uniref:low affinity immunoglobulin epsilon Fc receptor-like n=1 Tax=Procambarus clarkii TaxID=6728 RepID=UPI0037429D41